MADFKVVSDFEPQGDQPEPSRRWQRASTIACTIRSSSASPVGQDLRHPRRPSSRFSGRPSSSPIQDPRRPAAAEFKEFFRATRSEYFVSYYDFYQPEAYLPQTDTYIEKDSRINDEIDRLRHSATQASCRGAM